MKVVTQHVAAAALAIAMTTSSALAATSTAAQCAAVEVCYKGGPTGTACTIANGGCPPCVTFDSKNGCFEKVNGVCPFGTDCYSAWYSSSSGSGSTTTTTSSGSTSSNTDTSPSTGSASSTGSTSTGTNSTGSASASGSAAGNGEAGIGSSGGGSDMSVVFAIIGAAIGVIAVAVIFLTLVRRSRAARDDDDDMANTPPAFAKNNMAAPNSTTGNTAQYASYGRATAGSGASSTGIPTLGGPTTTATMEAGAMAAPSSGVMSYYSQQPPQNSAAPSPRVAGRAFPSAAPMGVGRASQPGVNYANAVSMNAQPVYQPEPVKAQAPPTPLQPAGAGVVMSPRTRRESYEF